MDNKISAIYGGSVRVRSCGICIKDNAILLVKHHGLGEKNILWAPPGGGVEQGETLSDALKREFLEETGLNVAVGDFLFINEFIQSPLHAIEVFFSVKILNGATCLGADPEMGQGDQIIKEVKFVTFEELRIMDQEMLHSTLRTISNKESLLNRRGYFKFDNNCIK